MRIAAGLVPVALVLFGSARTAAADKPYASAGVVSLGGTAELSHTSRTDTADGADEGADTSTTAVELAPVVGYFVIPRLELFGGLLFALEQVSPDEGEDVDTTAFGALAGAGYYVPAGSMFVGPRASFAYASGSTEVGDNESKVTGFQIEGAGALRIPFGWGGLLDLAAVLQYASADLEVNDNTLGDRSALSFGVELGFFVFF
jgi:hypothetical protein